MEMTIKLQKAVYGIMVVAMLLGSYFAFSIPRAAAAPAYDYKYITQSDYLSNVAPGSTSHVWIEVKNTGTKTWYNDGANPVRLGAGSSFGTAAQARDYTSEVWDSGSWISPNRATAISHGVILPGWHTRFEFDFKAPTTAGTYKAYFTPVAEYLTWMKDIGIYWEVTVANDGSVVVPVTPPTGSGLVVGLSSDSPAAGSVAKSAQNAIFTKVNLTAGSGSAVTVSSIKVKRGGVSSDSTITAVKLFDGATQIGATQGLNLTTATFSGLSLAIPAGTTKVLTIKANIASGAGVGNTVIFGINVATDVVLSDSGIVVSGTFPVNGNSKSVATITAGDVDIAASTTTPTLAPGSTDNNLGTFTFTETSSNENAYIDKVTFTRTGTTSDAEVTNLVIKDGATVIGSAASFSGGKATIDLSPDLKVLSGSTKTITVYADLASGVADDRTVIIGVNRKTDITAYGESSGGEISVDTNSSVTFPKNLGTATANIGTLTVSYGSLNPAQTTYVKGTADRDYLSMKFTAGSDEGVKITELTLTGVDGTENSDVNTALNSIKLWDGSTQIGSTGSLSGDGVTFYLSGTPIEVAKGGYKEIKVTASVSASASADTAGSGPYLKLTDIDTDITAYGLASGIQLAAADIGGTEPLTGNAHGIAASGSLVVSLASSSPAATTLAKGLNDVVLARYNLSVGSGEAVDVTALTARVYDSAGVNDASDVAATGDISNVRLMDGTTQLGSAVSNPSTGIATFSPSLRIQPNTTKVLTLMVNIPTSAAASLLHADLPGDADADLDADSTDTAAAITTTGVSSAADIAETGTATGNSMTISTGTIVASMGATPVAGNIVIGSSDVTVANILLAAGVAEDVVVNSIVVSQMKSATPVDIDSGVTEEDAELADTSNIKLFDGTTQIGSTIAAFTVGTDDTATFNDLALTIPAGTQKTITVKLTVNSTATAAEQILIGIASASDVDGTGVLSNAAIESTGTANGLSQNFVAGSTVTTTLHSSTPTEAIILGGSTDVPLSVFNFYSNNEDVTVTKVIATRVNGADGDFSAVKLYDGSTSYSGVFDPSADTYTFNNLSISVAKTVNKQITIKGDVNAVGAGSSSGDAPVMRLASGATNTTVQATGALSNSAATTTISSSLSGNAQIIRKAKPVVTVQQYAASTALANGLMGIFKFTVAASGPAGSTISLKKIELDTVDTEVTVDDGVLYDASTGQALTSDYSVTVTDGAGAATTDHDGQNKVFIRFGTELQIAAGQSRAFEVKATLGSVAAAVGDALVTSFATLDTEEDTLAENVTYFAVNSTNELTTLNAAVDGSSTDKNSVFIWSDTSAASHSGTSGSSTQDWTNAYRLNLPSDTVSLSKA